MLTVLLAVASIAVIVVTIAFVALVQGALRQAGKIGQASEDLSHLLRVAEEELIGIRRDARSTLDEIDRLAGKLTDTVERIGKAAAGAQRLLDGVYVVSTAAKAVKSSTAGLLGVYEGVKQGIRILRGSQRTDKGGISDEQ